MDWVVYSGPPIRGGEGVLNYLAGYTHRIAISRAAGARAAAYSSREIYSVPDS